MWLVLACANPGPPEIPVDTGAPHTDNEPDQPEDSGGDSSEPPPPEECNGADDDADGLVDEDFTDQDADGVSDCVDSSCVAEASASATVAIVCEGEVVAAPYAMEEKWNVQSGAAEWYEWWGANVPPIVADVDGDGRPEVLVAPSAADPYALMILSGTDGAVVSTYSFDEVAQFLSLATADVDGDGGLDILAMGEVSGDRLTFMRLDPAGSVVWSDVVDTDYTHTFGAGISLADLDADGQLELIGPVDIRDAATGEVSAQFPSPEGLFGVPSVGDVDLDGTMDIVLANALYDLDGIPVWSAAAFAGEEGWSMIVQADADPEGEVVMLGGRLAVYDTDGTLLHEALEGLPDERLGSPCVADFDGDGMSELAFSAFGVSRVVELDGTELWSHTRESGGGTNDCAAWDMDVDGAAELILAEEGVLAIHDGRTGAVLYESAAIQNHYGYNYPIVADLDADGSAEMVIASNPVRDLLPMVVALQHTGGEGWPSAGTTWPAQDYNTANYNSEGAVVDPGGWWDSPGLFHAQATGDLPYATDLTVSFVDVCASACPPDGVSQASVQVANRGAAPARAGLTLSLYVGEVLVTSATLTAIPAGTALESLTFDFAATTETLRAVVDDGDALIECDENNNEATWSSTLDCP